MKKRFLSIILAAVMVLSLIPATVFAADYTDTQGHWGEKAIDRWSSYDIVSGKGNGNFDPDGFMTRGEAAKVFANLFKLETKADLSGYTDVGLGKWYDDPIAKCINAGIMEGYGDGIINPTGTITREMFFVMFCRALGIKPVDTTEININDASNVSNYAKGYITALVNKGYISGITETENGITVAPKFNIDRASVMSLMDQTITTYVNTTEKVTAKDGLTLIVVDNANVTFANTTKDAEVYVFGKNTAITNAPVGTKVITSENASGTKVNGKSFNKDTTAIVEKPTPFDDESYTPPAPTEYTVTGVTLDKAGVTIEVGDADVKLIATVLPDNATNKNVTWSSSNENVATVSNGTVRAIAAGTATITVTTADGGKTATCTVTVTAAPATTYTVTFDMQGHGTQVASYTNIASGSKISAPTPVPTEKGYTFRYWYKEAACENQWNFSTNTVTTNTTLYAKWVKTISNILENVKDFPATSSDAVPENAWTNENGAKCYIDNSRTNNIRLFFNDTTKFTVGLNDALMSDGSDYYKTLSDSNVKISFVMENGVLKSIVVSGQTGNKAKLNGTYIATCIITLDPNGGTGGSITATVTKGATATSVITVPTKEGYTLEGWYTAATGGYRVLSPDGSQLYGAESYTAPEEPPTWDRTDSVTLYAHWIANTYTVKFDMQGNGATPTDVTVKYGETITAPAPVPTATDLVFGGWYKETSCTDASKWKFDTDTVTADTTLYAKWILVPAGSFVVTFDLNGVTGIMPDTQIIKSGEKVTKPTSPTNIEYDFVGWYKDASYTDPWDFDTDTVTGNMTLYARWTYSCVAAGTIVTMGNGEQKLIEELEIGDVIRTFDHETGEVSSAPVCFIWVTKNASGAFALTFEGNVKVTVIEEHGFYDFEEKQYVFINAENANDYIGHHFYDADNASWRELKSVEVLNGCVDAYSIITSGHLNHLSNGILSTCDGTTKPFANVFEYDDYMKYDADKKEADLKAYGLTSLETVLQYAGFIEQDYFDYNLQYLDVMIGKGIITWEWIEAQSEDFVEMGIADNPIHIVE